MTNLNLAAATSVPPHMPAAGRELCGAWHLLRGHADAADEANPATELCGEVAEFMGMLGDGEE